jgi:uncharacterized repeat protein (TIGR02543 family)
MLPTPEKPYSQFVGWFDATTDGTQITADTTVTANMTLYAYWNAEQFSINFNSRGGSDCNSVTRAYGDMLGPLPEPVRLHYLFLGWYDASVRGVRLDEFSVVSGYMTCYAYWQPLDYTVTLNSCGGTLLEPITRTYGTKLGVLPRPTRAGFVFAGWYFSKTGKTVATSNHYVYGPVTLYARWKSKDATLKKLRLSKGKLTSRFKPTKKKYNVVLSVNTASVRLKPTTKHKSAKIAIKVSGGGYRRISSVKVPVARAKKKIVWIRVTAQDVKTRHIYRVVIKRKAR